MGGRGGGEGTVKFEAFGAALVPAQLSPISSGSALLRGTRACRYGPRSARHFIRPPRVQWGTSPAKGSSVCTEGSGSWHSRANSQVTLESQHVLEGKVKLLRSLSRGGRLFLCCPAPQDATKVLLGGGKPVRFPLCEQYGKGAASLCLHRLNPHAQEVVLSSQGPRGSCRKKT